MADLRVLVTGSRDWADESTVFRALDAALAEHATSVPGGDWKVTVVHGACPTGADRFAAMWARYRRLIWAEHVTEERHPADWVLHGQRAGPIRNAEMVKAGAGLCLSFVAVCQSARCTGKPPHGSHGAVGCATLAERAGIPSRRYGFWDPPAAGVPELNEET